MLKRNCARRSQVNWLLWTPAAATLFFNPGGFVQAATNHSDASSTLEVVTIPSGQLSQQGLEGVIVPAIIMAALLVAAVLSSAAHLVKSECSHNDCGSGARGGGAGGSVGGRGGGGGGPNVDPNSPMPEMARHPNLVQQQLAPGTEGRKVDLVANFYKFNTTGMAVF